jgi:tetratricopeptide (TPR) repeat protein
MRFAVAVVLTLACHTAAAQHFHHAPDPSPAAPPQFRRSPCDKTYTRPPLDPALQKINWRVTGNETARKYFSQGLTEYFGFNYEAAIRHFRAALEADPAMAMAAWGIALASGSNINIYMEGSCAKQALDRSRQAVELAKTQPGISQLERDLTAALLLRYDSPDLASVAYTIAMRRIWNGMKQKDANVAALYAESMLDLRPWGLFDVAKRPALDTPEIIEALQAGLAADPSAVGANHFLIHAVEAGPDPGAALRSANVLRTLVPTSGHLVHMPSHVYLLTGDYNQAVASNSDALKVDLGEYEKVCAGTFEEYWANPECPAVYFGHYVGHNHHFRSVAAAFAGRSRDALQSARDTSRHVQRFVVNEPGLQRYLTTPMMMLVAHQRWEEALKEPEPPAGCFRQEPFMDDTGCHIVRAGWHWGRGMAHAANGRPAEAQSEYDKMSTEVGRIAPPSPTGWGNNVATTVLKVPAEVLLARISWITKRPEEAIEHLKLAVTHEDTFTYDEPPQWFVPARESLGGAYLQTGAFALARDTFEAALKRHPKSGRALYGLMRALRELRDPRAAEVEKQFRAAWTSADYEMSDQKLW